MADVKIPVVAEGGLTKAVFCFTFQYGQLEYTSHEVYNRSTTRERWADEVERKVLPYDQWCEKHNRDPEEYAEYDGDYRAYRDSLNPVCQKTRQGKTKMSGLSACIEHLPPCPTFVAQRAKTEFARQLKVKYKP